MMMMMMVVVRMMMMMSTTVMMTMTTNDYLADYLVTFLLVGVNGQRSRFRVLIALKIN